MNITIKICTDNAAFDDDPNELSRIIRAIGHKLHSLCLEGGDSYPIFDSNGNKVGILEVTE